MWILWTLVMLSGPLMNFQLTLILIIATVSILIIKALKTRDKKLSKLEAALADAEKLKNRNFDEAIFREKAKQEAESNFFSRIYPIDGTLSLKSEMQASIKNASSRVLIMSGWTSDYVIDEQFINSCISKLKEHIELHFGFGYNSSSSQRMPQWERRGRYQIEKLMVRALESECDNNLFIYEFDNHYKSLVKDSEYFITGSINWLSNKKGKNFERAWKTQIPELADREFKDCISIMRPKRLILRRKLLKPFIEWTD